LDGVPAFWKVDADGMLNAPEREDGRISGRCAVTYDVLSTPWPDFDLLLSTRGLFQTSCSDSNTDRASIQMS
jgi:hypothetical protein